MNTFKRSAHALWKGNLSNGHGLLTSESKALDQVPFTFDERVKEKNAMTNPEELLAATAASCFGMALSKTLEDAGALPEEIDVDADVTLDTSGEGPRITTLRLRVGALVPDYSEEDLRQSVEKTEQACPVYQLIQPGLVTLETETRVLKMAS